MNMLYPLRLTPVYKERIWGGRTLEEKYHKHIPDGKIGESWEVASHDHGVSIIANGELERKKLSDAIAEYGRMLLGDGLEEAHYDKFPLLIKILDAKDVLSVQVHPDDAYAQRYENGELGKTEAWYIIDAKPGARLVYGIQEGCTREEFERAIREGRLEPYLSWVDVKPGDVLYIPSGMVHAIGEGILICEVQQNSDTVYRVYDWNRVGDDGKPRQLHIEKALDVIRFQDKHYGAALKGLEICEGDSRRIYYIVSKYFALELLKVRGKLEEKADGSRFYTYTMTEGQGTILYQGGQVECKGGESYLIPACLGEYSIEGDCDIIKAYVPDKDKIKTCLANAFDEEQINCIAGFAD